MMKAAVYSKSHLGKLDYRDTDKPVPKENEILVRVRAVSLNAADYRLLKVGIAPKKKIPGADVAGTIEAVGKKVKLFKPGDEVLGDLAGFGFGGLAEYVAAPEEPFALKPSALSFEDAAALPIAGLTALQGLRDKGKIQEGYKVLLAGCAGGVGTFAIQLAKYFGAIVTGVCSSANVEQSYKLGADKVINYEREDFTKLKESYNLIFAINGNRRLTEYKKLLTKEGVFVMAGGDMPQIIRVLLFGKLMSAGTKKMLFLAAKPLRSDLEFLANLAASGKIKPAIEKQFPLSEAGHAMDYIFKGHAKGKIIVVP